jgi:ribosomal protein L32
LLSSGSVIAINDTAATIVSKKHQKKYRDFLAWQNPGSLAHKRNCGGLHLPNHSGGNGAGKHNAVKLMTLAGVQQDTIRNQGRTVLSP